MGLKKVKFDDEADIRMRWQTLARAVQQIIISRGCPVFSFGARWIQGAT